MSKEIVREAYPMETAVTDLLSDVVDRLDVLIKQNNDNQAQREAIISLMGEFIRKSGVAQVDKVESRIERVKGAFSADLAGLLHIFYEEGGTVVVKATKWLTPERYNQISTIINKLQGEWIKDGKNSRWTV